MLGHTVGPEPAARSLATTMRELVSRRPVIRSDTLQGFAYLSMLGGDDMRWREITDNTTPFGANAIGMWLYLSDLGATQSDALERLERRTVADPPLERFARAAQHSQRLIDEEFARWS